MFAIFRWHCVAVERKVVVSCGWQNKHADKWFVALRICVLWWRRHRGGEPNSFQLFLLPQIFAFVSLVRIAYTLGLEAFSTGCDDDDNAPLICLPSLLFGSHHNHYKFPIPLDKARPAVCGVFAPRKIILKPLFSASIGRKTVVNRTLSAPPLWSELFMTSPPPWCDKIFYFHSPPRENWENKIHHTM
jgi:hypothetical protein